MTRALLREFGALRLALLAAAAAAALFATEPGAALSLEGMRLIATLVLPAAAPLLLFGLLFEILMSAVRCSDAADAERGRWRRILAVEGLFALALVLAWAPFFGEIFAPLL